MDAHYARPRVVGARILEEPHATEYAEHQYASEKATMMSRSDVVHMLVVLGSQFVKAEVYAR